MRFVVSEVCLTDFDNRWFDPGRSRLVQVAWFFVGLPLLRARLLPFSGVRRWILRCFGTRLGAGVVIRPGVRVKYPWRLTIGNSCWIGEDAWIDNLGPVDLGNNVCVSQGAYFCTGNHDWSAPAFGLIVGAIRVGDGAWVGAKALICPGVELGQCAIASAGSVITRDIPAYEIHAGNPARFVRKREFKPPSAGAYAEVRGTQRAG